MEILTSVRRLYISFKSPVNDFVYSFGRAALLLLVEVQNHTVAVRERGRIRVNASHHPFPAKLINLNFVKRICIKFAYSVVSPMFELYVQYCDAVRLVFHLVTFQVTVLLDSKLKWDHCFWVLRHGNIQYLPLLEHLHRCPFYPQYCNVSAFPRKPESI